MDWNDVRGGEKAPAAGEDDGALGGQTLQARIVRATELRARAVEIRKRAVRDRDRAARHREEAVRDLGRGAVDALSRGPGEQHDGDALAERPCRQDRVA